MFVSWLGFIGLYVATKSGEILLEWLLTQFWQWVFSEENLKNLTTYLKLKIIILYLDWLLKKNPFK